MTSHQSRQPRGSRKTMIVGFDFGTHSTKIVVRERNSADGRIVQIDKDVLGYPPSASPSVVRIVDDQLFFGTEALEGNAGTLCSSLKVCLLTGHQFVESVPTRLNTETIIAAYFAWAFQRLRSSLLDDTNANVFINVAAPMSHIETPELKERYLRIVQAAWELSFGNEATPIQHGISCQQAHSLTAPLLKRSVIGPQHRKVEILPETIAPVVSLSLDPWMSPGMYMIIDTGAGTTEMSVFHAGEPGADQTVLCYRDETMLLGGNDFQLAERLCRHEQNGELEKIIKKLEKQYRRIWHVGYQLDAPNHQARARWKELTLVLSGGGTRHDRVAARLKNVNPIHPWLEYETLLDVCRHSPATLDLNGNFDENDGSMYAVANGLAIERRHWPIVFQPDEIEPLAATEEVVDKPQGYWYLD